MIATVPCTGYPLVDCAEKDDTDSISLRGAFKPGVSATFHQSEVTREQVPLVFGEILLLKQLLSPTPKVDMSVVSTLSAWLCDAC